MSKEDDPTRAPPSPVQLQYFAADTPGPPIPRATMFCWTGLAVAWLPFACGVISSQAVARSGVADVIDVHHHAGAAFMAFGMLITVACGYTFLRQGKATSALFAAMMLGMQICLFLCVGAV